MTNEERALITGLFDRLRQADVSAKDSEAEQLIQQLTAAQPSAPYLFVQTLLVQEHALQNAQAKIAGLEQRLAAAPAPASGESRGFLSSILHPSSPSAPPPLPSRPAATAYAIPPAVPYPSTASIPPSGGGGFLKTALTTAAGVAGGELLFRGIEGLLGHNPGAFAPAFGAGYGGFGSAGGQVEEIETVRNVENIENVTNIENVENVRTEDDRDLAGGDASIPADDQIEDTGADSGQILDDPSATDGDDNAGGNWA